MQVGAQAECPIAIEQRRQQPLGQLALLRQQRQALAQLYRGLQRQWVIAIDIARQDDAQQPRTGIATLTITA
ncbi:hypothetical protein D3C85_1062790 [compost metagenome]